MAEQQLTGKAMKEYIKKRFGKTLCTNDWCNNEMDEGDLECLRCDSVRYDAMMDAKELSEEEVEELIEVQYG